jgi:hypothetical protein
MIIQTAPSDTPRLAIMMYEHTALCLQFAHAFGNRRFEPLAPADLMIYVISNHEQDGSTSIAIRSSMRKRGFHTILPIRRRNTLRRLVVCRLISTNATMRIAV